MKKLFYFFLLVAPYVANCQVKANVKAQILGYKYNDTIKMEDFLRIGELSLNNKNFTIESFTVAFAYEGYNYEYKANSKDLPKEMKKELLTIKDNNNIKVLVINFIDIYITKPQAKPEMIGDLIYKLKVR